MDLQLDEQQELLRQSLERFLDKRLPFEVRRVQRSGGDFLAFWNALENELGIAAAGLPEDVGGFSGGAEAEMIVAGSLGRALAVTPYTVCHVLSAHLLTALGERDRVRDIASGRLLIVTAIEEPQTRGDVRRIECCAERMPDGWRLSGKKLTVDFAGEADVVLIPTLIDGEFAIFALTREQFAGAVHPFKLIDDTPSADLVLDGIEVPDSALLAQGPSVVAALEAAIDRARAALCAEGAGVAEIMVSDTVAYAREREQFGVALASFQALQHRMVNMWISAQELGAAALLATLKSTQPDAVSAAKATMAENLRLIGQEAVQLHGAMGLTEELRVGHYFKRATVLEHRLGNASYHIDRYRKAS